MPPIRGRKRSHDKGSPNGPGKRLRTRSQGDKQRSIREVSPSKNVHFPRDLVIGPNPSDPNRRSESPIRSALHRREIILDSPDAQLHAEEEIMSSTNARKGKRVVQPKTKPRKLDEKTKSPEGVRLEEVLNARGKSTLSIGLAAAHDAVSHQLNHLKSKVQVFVESFPANKQSDPLTSLLKPGNKLLVRYISCLAIGGKNGSEGWRELLSDTQCRHAIVFGIIGRALKEAVFDALCFGAKVELLKILSEKEKGNVQRDGFFRTKDRADTILRFQKKITTLSLGKAVTFVTLQLEHMLLPLWEQGGTAAAWKSSHRRDELAQIVASAAHISISMRKDRDTVYYWPPTFKDEEFEPQRMECINLSDMIAKSPYDNKKTSGYKRAILRKGHEHEAAAIVRVVCFPGVVAYQQGGGDLAKRELEEEYRESESAPPDVGGIRNTMSSRRGRDEITGEEGFRTKVLCKAAVLLQWGTQRLLTKEAGTSAHQNAMDAGGQRYEQNNKGFVELYELFMEEEASQLKSSLQSGGLASHRQSWMPNVPRLFPRSPSLQ